MFLLTCTLRQVKILFLFGEIGSLSLQVRPVPFCFFFFFFFTLPFGVSGDPTPDVLVFHREGGIWVQHGTKRVGIGSSGFASSIAISNEGRLAVGSATYLHGLGGVYINPPLAGGFIDVKEIVIFSVGTGVCGLLLLISMIAALVLCIINVKAKRAQKQSVEMSEKISVSSNQSFSKF